MPKIPVLFVNLQEIRDYSEFTEPKYMPVMRETTFG